LILDQVQGYETQLQQQQTEVENASEKLDNAEKECWRLSSENGNFISKVIYHFHDGNVLYAHFRTV
jgi:multidrug resistance efflux pump